MRTATLLALLCLAACQNSPKGTESFTCLQTRGSCRAFVDANLQTACSTDADCEVSYVDCGESACEVPAVVGRRPIIPDDKLAIYQKLREAVKRDCRAPDSQAVMGSCESAPLHARCVDGKCAVAHSASDTTAGALE